MLGRIVLLCGWLCTMSLAGGVHFEEFHDHPGIYLEEVGRAFIITDEWKMILFYDLANYWHEWDSLVFLAKRLSTTCYLQSSSSNHTQPEGQSTECDPMLESIRVMMTGIRDRNVMLKAPIRVKRAPLEFIGTFLSEAFGVLDQRAAVQYETQINELRTGTLRMSKLIQQQTHVLEVTTNLVKKQQEQIQTQYRQVQAALRAVTDHAEYTDMVFQLVTHITLFKEMQEAMIDVIVDLHQGHLNTKLLTPDQLRDQLKQMKEWAPADVQVPDYQQHWVQLYQLLRVKARLVNNYLIFELRVPLFGAENYQVYRSHPIPTIVQDRMAYIQPTSELILVNLQRTYYYPMTMTELEDCQKWDLDQWICPQKGALYTAQDGDKPCEIQLLQHEEQAAEQCPVRTTAKQTYIRPLIHANTWIISVAQKQTLDIICNNTVQHTTIQRSGLLSLESGCLIKSKKYLLRSMTTHTSQQPVWFLPSFNLSKHTAHSVNLETVNLEPEVLEMVEAVQTLNKEESWSSLNIHDIPQYALSSILTVPVILLFIAWWRRRRLAQLIYNLNPNHSANSTTTQQTQRPRRNSCSV